MLLGYDFLCAILLDYGSAGPPAYNRLESPAIPGTKIVNRLLVIAAAVIGVARYGVHRQLPSADLAVVSQTVNLWDAGTVRGSQPGSLQSVLLPAAVVRVTIILPRFSPPGRYAVAVTQDQNGNGVVAQRSAPATINGDHESVSVELDLRAAKPGAYFLATTHEQDQASYYYPLQIK